jgi:hypothetical protein
LLKRHQRLVWKEVRFLTRKRQVFSYWLFTMYYIEQYPNRLFHQFSYHIPLLVSKRAVVRHKVKRILLCNLEARILPLDFWNMYYKWFITLNKSKLSQLLAFLEKKDSTQLETYLVNEHEQFFSSFLKRLWKKIK